MTSQGNGRETTVHISINDNLHTVCLLSLISAVFLKHLKRAELAQNLGFTSSL